MIKANELRLTNLVIYNGEYKRVKDLFFMVKNPFEYDQIKAEPIPLTPKILEKAGFQMPSQTKDLNDTFFIYEENGFWLQAETHTCCERFQTPCQYVHQLQNLYYALTGEELQITL